MLEHIPSAALAIWNLAAGNATWGYGRKMEFSRVMFVCPKKILVTSRFPGLVS